MTTPACRAAAVTMPMSLSCRFDPEAGREVAGEHAGRFALQDRVPREAAGQHLQRRFCIDAVGLEEHDRFSHQFDGAGHDDLVSSLDRLS